MKTIIILSAIIIIVSNIQCNLPVIFTCPYINTCPPNTTSIISSPQTVYQCNQTLVLSANQLNIQGSFSSLTLSGQNITLSNLQTLSTLDINVNENLNINSQIIINGLLLVSSDNMNTMVVNINAANVQCSKIFIIKAKNIYFINSDVTALWSLCLYYNISIIQTSNQIQTYISNNDMTALSNLNFSIFFFSTNITIELSRLNGVSFSMIAEANISVILSNINATAQSCTTNTGLGRGAIVQYANTYCTSGSSSCGFGVISNSSLCSGVVQYFLFLSHSFPYINKGPYLSTGSGGYGYNLNQNGNGAGGGIIYMICKEQMLIESSIIEASGGSVYQNDILSAGSGGTIFITSNVVIGRGNNNITSTGGNSLNNKGAGGGGLIKISYYSVNQTPVGSMWININQGYQINSPEQSVYSNGIFYGPLCDEGTQSYYMGCTPCNSSQFSTLGDPVCRPCPYSQQFEINSSEGKTLLSQCYLIKRQTDFKDLFTPGEINFINITVYLAALIIFTIVGVILKKKIKKEKLLSGEEFKLQDVQKDIEKAKILALELRKSKDIKPHQLMYHAHRISCFGSNSQQSPWVLPTTVPFEVRKYVLPQVYSNFAQSFNEQARWTKFEYWLSKLSCCVYPLYWVYLDKIKKKKYKKLYTLLENAIDYNLINNYDYEDRSIVTIKFSKNKDYTNCYLDFFVYQRVDLKYFNLSSPFILYLSGEGNFLRPFYLEQGDIFFRLMFFVVNRQFLRPHDALDEKKQLFSNMVSQKKKQKNNFQLNRFLRKLNTLACTLDLSSTNNGVVEVLWSLVEFIQKWNQQFFNKLGVQLNLIIFMSRLMNKTVIDNQIQILTKRDKQQFKTFIIEKIKQIQSWEESSIKIGLFVYNPQQEIPKEEELRRSLIDDSEVHSNEDNQQSYLKTYLLSQNIREKKIHQKMGNKIIKFVGLVRHFMMSHQNSRFDEYTIKFLQSFFILMQTMLVFIWSIKIQIPYVFVNLVMPFIGIIWFVSDSYGFGKLYLIFNAMSFIDEIITLITYSSYESVAYKNQDLMIQKNIICSFVNVCIIVFMMFLGNRAITQSKKLSLKKEDEIQPLKFE